MHTMVSDSVVSDDGCAIPKSTYAYKYQVPYTWMERSDDEENWGKNVTITAAVYCCCLLNLLCGCDDFHENRSFVPALVGIYLHTAGEGAPHNLISLTRHATSSSADVPDRCSTLPEACLLSLRSTVSSYGCGEMNQKAAESSRTSEVYLCGYLIYTVSRDYWLPSWSWTTHWAIEVDVIYYEPCRDRGHPAAENKFKLEHRTLTERNQFGQEERHKDFLHLLIRVTHLSNEQLIRIGETHAEIYRWDPLIRNCQTFLHEAYFGKPLLSPPGKRKEIRCAKHGRLRPIPAFTIQVLGMGFSSVYLIEQGVEWVLGLTLSPATLMLWALPVMIGTAYFIPALNRTAKAYWSQYRNGGGNSSISITYGCTNHAAREGAQLAFIS
ncbi:hypothetical protein BDV34DRAFT_225099 [Aspergillus parasiticus]|uniref:DUF7732 domain-containing protein n=1 Tax=Aspergillus parasiticus TaxID=5067 RepID=A0A5N6DKQ1_ASPPA|nr:hypothetical protein BDV34DRAFT_225099 [Aspergillus parasiticus]